jgi:hypothetical protein
MFQVLTRIASREAGRMARDAARRVALLVVGLVFVTLALAFGGVGLFFWFVTFMPPALAGAGVAGLSLVIALVALLAASRRRTREPEPAHIAGAPVSDDERRLQEAEALGRMISRDLKGFPLVITALAVGMIAGRMRR